MVHVRPKANRNGIDGPYGQRLKISVAAPPVKGKANDELRKFLAKKLRIPKSAIVVATGETGRKKRLLIDGVPPAAVVKTLTK